MKKVLFIDRDGTIIGEPKGTEQVDSLELLEFIPNVIGSLNRLQQQTDFELVMVTNQDGLGTDSYPEDTFWPAHNKMLTTLKGEGVSFAEVVIDRTFAAQNANTRKPQTALMSKYMHGNYDLKNSYVIGDRYTDIEFAKNLNCKSIFFGENSIPEKFEAYCDLQTVDWNLISDFLIKGSRKSVVERNTNETDIKITLDLNGSGKSNLNSGLEFFDHMLDQIARHGNVDLSVEVKGDLGVDEHHTIEDTAIVLGEVFRKALGAKKGIERYGFCLPMDDCLVQVALDFGGRPWLVWDANFKRERIGDMPTEMFIHFFKSFSDSAKCNLNIKATGENEHHKIEGIFKAFAKAIKMAIRNDSGNFCIPSTKGEL